MHALFIPAAESRMTYIPILYTYVCRTKGKRLSIMHEEIDEEERGRLRRRRRGESSKQTSGKVGANGFIEYPGSGVDATSHSMQQFSVYNSRSCTII